MTARWLASVLTMASAMAADPTAGAKARSEALQKILLAPCCWSEPVATHRSEVAAEMRAEIGRLVAEGRTDREILDLYKTRYGMRILIEPEGASAVWMNTVPVVVALIGLAGVGWVIHRWARRRPQPSAG